jgi:hypothetical protein
MWVLKQPEMGLCGRSVQLLYKFKILQGTYRLTNHLNIIYRTIIMM